MENSQARVDRIRFIVMNKNIGKEVILSIDTSSNIEVEVGLTINGEKIVIKKQLDRNKAQVVMPIIEELLVRHGLKPRDITRIKVNVGPGSFTGLRVGVSLANTLGLYLQIPINNNPVGQIVTPVYS
jgi:tRNA threonylcarbamoyladenosine biosynthesis protein TsaB